MSRRLHSPRFWILVVLCAAVGAGAAFAATSLSGFRLHEETEAGAGIGSSSSGYSSYAVLGSTGGGAAGSPSGFASFTGPAAPVSSTSTAVEDWKQLSD